MPPLGPATDEEGKRKCRLDRANSQEGSSCFGTGTKAESPAVLAAFTRECLAPEAGTSIRFVQVRRVLGSILKESGIGQDSRSDNGSEFTSKELRDFLAESRTRCKSIKMGN